MTNTFDRARKVSDGSEVQLTHIVPLENEARHPQMNRNVDASTYPGRSSNGKVTGRGSGKASKSEHERTSPLEPASPMPEARTVALNGSDSPPPTNTLTFMEVLAILMMLVFAGLLLSLAPVILLGGVGLICMGTFAKSERRWRRHAITDGRVLTVLGTILSAVLYAGDIAWFFRLGEFHARCLTASAQSAPYSAPYANSIELRGQWGTDYHPKDHPAYRLTSDPQYYLNGESGEAFEAVFRGGIRYPSMKDGYAPHGPDRVIADFVIETAREPLNPSSPWIHRFSIVAFHRSNPQAATMVQG